MLEVQLERDGRGFKRMAQEIPSDRKGEHGSAASLDNGHGDDRCPCEHRHKCGRVHQASLNRVGVVKRSEPWQVRCECQIKVLPKNLCLRE